MTGISIWEDGEGYFIEAAGHSGFDTAGRDAVCAGISTLVFAEIELTRKMESEGYFHHRTAILGEGYAYLHVQPKKENRERLAGSFAAVREGLRLIEKSYPGYVEVKERNDERQGKDRGHPAPRRDRQRA